MEDGSMPDETGELTDVCRLLLSQNRALAACLGTLMGALRLTGALDDAVLADIFARADAGLPDETSLGGAETLATLRVLADQIIDRPA
jgi:hypothetical protein